MSLAQFQQMDQCAEPDRAPTVSENDSHNLPSNDEVKPSGSQPTQRQEDSEMDRLPPIVVTGTSLEYVRHLIAATGVIHYTANTTTNAITVFVTNTKDFKAILDTFKQHRINCFTHQLPEARTTKVMVRGLPETDVEDIAEALAAFNIRPITIKTIRMPPQQFHRQAKYLLHFPKESITLDELRQVRHVNHHRVYFDLHTRQRVPMQCKNCQKYGHGQANCFRTPKCVKCAGAHTSSMCPRSKTTTNPGGRLALADLRCANCGDRHTANFHGCPARRTIKPAERAKEMPGPSFQLIDESFPSLPKVSPAHTTETEK